VKRQPAASAAKGIRIVAVKMRAAMWAMPSA